MQYVVAKNLNLLKKQETKGILSNLGIKTPLSKIRLLGDVLFQIYKMNEIVNNFSLAGDKFMPEMHLRQPQFVYSAFGPFTENEERIQNFKDTGDTSYIYKNQLDKACFQHDLAYEDFKDLPKGTAADKVLRDRAFKIASDQNYDGYQRGLASMVYKFFDKKSQGKGLANNKENVQLANELHEPIIKKFNKRKVYSSFRCRFGRYAAIE